jgi:hypothetical protein
VLRYRALTKLDFLGSGFARKIEPEDPFEKPATAYMEGYAPDEVVAVVAEDNGNFVGRTLLAHTDILVGDRLQRCAVGANLWAEKTYRKRAVGIKILWKVLDLGFSYVGADSSADSRRLFERAMQFHRVDDSPVYGAGIDLGGAVRMSRLSIQAKRGGGVGLSQLGHAATLARMLLGRRRLLGGLRPGWTVVSPGEAASLLSEVASLREDRRVYLPWNRSLLVAALHGERADVCAWVLSKGGDGPGGALLVSMYMGGQTLGLWRRRDVRTVRVARLAEAFPPVEDEDTARHVISFVARQAEQRGASTLFVYAMTAGLELACRRLGLSRLSEKTVFIAPGDLDDKVAAKLSDSRRWWCRAINENQFEEAYQPLGASRKIADSPDLI